MAKIRERNRELIINVASEFFAKKGYAATKTVEIANSAGLPKANVYYYFKTKENLYRCVLESIIQPLHEASAPLHENDDPKTALTEYIRAKIQISQTHPYSSKVLANEIMHGAPHLPDDIAAEMHQQAKLMSERIQYWIDQGLMANVSPQHLLFTIWAATQTYADFDWQISKVTEKEKLEQSDYDQASDLIIKMVLNGCEVKESPPPSN